MYHPPRLSLHEVYATPHRMACATPTDVAASAGFHAAAGVGNACFAYLTHAPTGQPRPRFPQLPADSRTVVLDIEGATTLIRLCARAVGRCQSAGT